MALCRDCDTVIPCHCHLHPPVQLRPGVYAASPPRKPAAEGGPAVTRQLNACGFSTETIAAEYETDAALAEADNDMTDPYFVAAFKAEDEQRALDWAAASQRAKEPQS